MSSALEYLKGPLWVIEQATLNNIGLAIFTIWVAALALLTWRAKVGWSRVWPTLTLPLPWIALAIWTGLHWRSAYGPQTGFHAEPLGIGSLVVTIGMSAFAIWKAKGARLPVAGLTLLNIWVCFIGALVGAMATTGAWL